MTPTDFSVLLLAWDDADPSVAVLGGAALPPTLPLVYHLAAEQPVLAVFPHLPQESVEMGTEFEAEAHSSSFSSQASATAGHAPASTATPATETAATDSPEAATETAATGGTGEAEGTEATTEADAEATPTPETSGIRRLTVAAGGTKSAFTSVLIGLEDRAAAASPTEIKEALPSPKTPAALSATQIRSQWPTGATAPQHLSWAAPAAPYLGATASAGPPVLMPVPPLVPAPTVREAADLAQAALSWPVGFSPLAAPVAAPSEASANNEESEASKGTEDAQVAEAAENAAAVETAEEAVDAAAPQEAGETDEPKRVPATSLRPEAFEELTEEVGAAEANDLSAPEDDLTLDAPVGLASTEPAPATEAATFPTVAKAAPQPAPALTARLPPLDGLNSRMINYARQAAQLVQNRSDFGVIYAPSWPAWLAALEIRNSSRRPLVLYAASLAAEFASPAERGWLLEVERMTLRRAHLILVPSEQVRRQLRRHYGSETGEVRVVPAADEDAVRALLQGLAAG